MAETGKLQGRRARDSSSTAEKVQSSKDAKHATILIEALEDSFSPRLEGEDEAHVHRLAEIDSPPPILVHRATLRVIDGMHRLRAAIVKGQSEIQVQFFDGDLAEAYLLAVEANVTHGLPLSLADRKAAVVKIISAHPDMSDRAIASCTGLAPNTVGSIRRSTVQNGQSNGRVGKDGRRRPLSAAEGRRKAAEVLRARPSATLREVANEAKISVSTAHDVRRRLLSGNDPSKTIHQLRPKLPNVRSGSDSEERRNISNNEQEGDCTVYPSWEELSRDPSLRFSDKGRQLLRWLHAQTQGIQDFPDLVAAIPPHRVSHIAQILRCGSRDLDKLAYELEKSNR